jgi:YHS domain-containing protein
MKSRTLLSLAVMALLAATVYAAEKVDLEGIKCPVSGQPAKEGTGVDYKGAQVFFCCDKCPKAFAAKHKTDEKLAAKANQQLVATKQAKEVKCPVSGQDLNPDTTIEVNGVEVAFCCNKCKAAAEKKTGDDQIVFLFGDKAFDKGFKVEKKDKK